LTLLTAKVLTQAMAATLTVNLSERSYPILFAGGLVAEMTAQVRLLQSAGRKIAVLTDRNVAAHQGGLLDAALGGVPRIIVEPG
jgi:3-dehydroquinate synthase